MSEMWGTVFKATVLIATPVCTNNVMGCVYLIRLIHSAGNWSVMRTVPLN
jgi:hypothetical protein